MVNSQTDTTYAVLYFVLCALGLRFLSQRSVAFFVTVLRRFRTFSNFFSILNIVCILSFKLPRNPRNSRENFPCFYRVIETRFFLAFDQSAPVFLKGYFIKEYIIMYYLKHEQECFIRYKTRGDSGRFISDKARTASVLNGF